MPSRDSNIQESVNWYLDGMKDICQIGKLSILNVDYVGCHSNAHVNLVYRSPESIVYYSM